MPPALTIGIPTPVLAPSVILQDYVGKGRALINFGLDVRRRQLASMTIAEWERRVDELVPTGIFPTIRISIGRKDVNRAAIESAANRFTALHNPVGRWLAKSKEFVSAFDQSDFEPRTLTNWGSILDEMTRLLAFTTAGVRLSKASQAQDRILEDIILRGEKLIGTIGDVVKKATTPSTLITVAIILGGIVSLILLLRFIV